MVVVVVVTGDTDVEEDITRVVVGVLGSTVIRSFQHKGSPPKSSMTQSLDKVAFGGIVVDGVAVVVFVTTDTIRIRFNAK